MNPVEFVRRNSRVVGALLMREIITRFGREGLGFLWIVGEPLMFCFGVLVMWSILKPEYEHGVRLGPFVMTGYMSLLLLRHQISNALGAIQGNIGLLHHRQVHVLHLYFTRNLLEFLGGSVAFVIVYIALILLGQVSAPKDWLLLYGGWLLMGWMGSGLAMLFAGLALRFEVMEKLVQLLTYILVPVSGAFFMAEWIPGRFREAYLLIPLPHGVEMIRAGVFGEFVATHYNGWYALAWGGIFNLFGMALLADAKDRVDIE